MGCNISCDLRIEHINRRLKGMMNGMCDTKAIERAAKAIGVIKSTAFVTPWRGMLAIKAPVNTKHCS